MSRHSYRRATDRHYDHVECKVLEKNKKKSDLREAIISYTTKSDLNLRRALGYVGEFIRTDTSARSLFFWMCDVLFCVVQHHVSGDLANPTEDSDAAACQRAFLVTELLRVDPTKLPTHAMKTKEHRLETLWRTREDVDNVIFAMRCRWTITSFLQLRKKENISPDWIELNVKTVQAKLPVDADEKEPDTRHVLWALSPLANWLHVCVQLAKCCELVHDFTHAISLWKTVLSYEWYRPIKRGFFSLRLALCLEQNKSTKEHVLCTVEKALKSCGSMRFADRYALERSARRLHKPPLRWGPFHGVLLEKDFKLQREVVVQGVRDPMSKRWLWGQATKLTVEDYTLQTYLARLGPHWRGVHCEGSLLSGLFHLLMWDVIYADLGTAERNPFPSRYHSLPVDYGTVTFCPHRHNIIRRRLTQIESMTPLQLGDDVARLYAEKRGIASASPWDLFDIETLRWVCIQMTAKSLCVIFRHVLREFSFGGLPDLWMWSLEMRREEEGKGLCVVEVKGPGDSLMDTQVAWNYVLCRAGVRVEVCRVRAEQIIEI